MTDNYMLSSVIICICFEETGVGVQLFSLLNPVVHNFDLKNGKVMNTVGLHMRSLTHISDAQDRYPEKYKRIAILEVETRHSIEV